MKKYFFLLYLSAVLASCSSGKLSKSDTLLESETIILGEIKIVNEGKDVTKNAKIYFDENVKGVLSYRLDEEGLLLMKLPKGNHFIKYIYTPYGSINLPVGYANIAVPDAGKTYYIGTIVIDTQGKLRKKSRGIIYDTDPKGLKEEKAAIVVTDAPEKVAKAYQEEFGKDTKVEKALMTVNE